MTTARQTLRNVALAEASVVDDRAPTHGSVTFSAVGATIDYLALSISALRVKAPDVHVKVHTPDNELDLRQAVYTGYSEFGLTPVEPGETLPLPRRILRDLEVDSLGYALFTLVLPPGAQVPDPVPLDELPDLPIVAAPETAIGRRLVEKHLRNLRVRTRLGATVGHRDAQIPLVQYGIGMAFLSSQSSLWASRRGCKTARTDPPLLLDLAVIRRREPLGPAAQSLLDCVRAMSHTHLEHPTWDDSRN